MKKLSYSATALKQLAKLATADVRRIRAKLEQYAADPASLTNQVKALKGGDALRLRVGDYRVIFTEDGLILLVLRIGHRREVYR